MNEHVSRKEFRRWVRGAVIGFAILLSANAYVLSTKSDTSALSSGLHGSCQQIGVLQAEANLYTFTAFQGRVSSAKRERALAKKGPNSAEHLKSAIAMESQAAVMPITGLAECDQAVNNANYKFPLAITIGNPHTGVVTPTVRQILEESRRALTENTVPAG